LYNKVHIFCLYKSIDLGLTFGNAGPYNFNSPAPESPIEVANSRTLQKL